MYTNIISYIYMLISCTLTSGDFQSLHFVVNNYLFQVFLEANHVCVNKVALIIIIN